MVRLFGISAAVWTALVFSACADGVSPSDVPFVDAGIVDADASSPVDAGPDDAPSTTELQATATSFSTARLDWLAPTDESGKAAAYDLRVSGEPITNETEFLAADLVKTIPTPSPSGTAEKLTLTGLPAGATLHFALRSRDAAFHWSAISNDAPVTLFPRAKFIISEVAPQNGAADGYDFIELEAAAGGRADGIRVTQIGGTLYTFGAFTVQKGERVVVHVAGDPCPAGCVNEETSGNKAESKAAFANDAAWDVYAEATGITGTDNAISVMDGTVISDVLVFSNRDSDAASASMTAFASLAGAGWTFPAPPVDGVNDCETQRAAATAATTDTACGGFPIFGNGKSLNRVSGPDTDSKRDFYVASGTPGMPNAQAPVPALASVSVASSSELRLSFDQEMDPASIVPINFSVTGGLTLATATLEEVNLVSVKTATQVEGALYSITVGTTLKSLQGVPLAVPVTTSFCGYSANGPKVLINEVAPNVAGGTDLVELLVTRGGPLGGIQLRATPALNGSGGSLLATLPALCGVANDLVVVHLHPAAAPIGSLAASSETLKKDEFVSASYSGNYDGAWDVLSTNTQEISSLRSVLYLRAADGTTVLDGLALYGSLTPPQSYVDAVTFLQSVGEWLPKDCAGLACDATTVVPISVPMSTVGTSASGPTVQRLSAGLDAHSANDFAVAASTMGVAN